MPQPVTDAQIFAGRTSMLFASKVCDYLGMEMGQSETIVFSEGALFVKVLEKVRDKDVYVIQTIGTKPNDEFMELLFYVDAFKRASASSVTAILPYFAYAKGDKKDEPRVSIRARVCADCLEAAGVDRIITMDLHSPQIQGFFKKPVDHLYAMDALCTEVRKHDVDNLVVVAPDTGFAKNARKYANKLGVGLAIGDKVRRSHNELAEVEGIIGDVAGLNALIVDDFTISCGTLASTARYLKKLNAERIFACVSHCVMSDRALDELTNSPIERLYITDTVENAAAFNHPKIKVVSMAPVFGEAIRIIHNRESLSQLFDGQP
ncbi:MAG: ribose-phosphate pyrophosphokinase [Defluviitaleaceae bacterium]|nr:ribose-phosphate pyrophosphokinase [Defluviitaleaceae bacterium]